MSDTMMIRTCLLVFAFFVGLFGVVVGFERAVGYRYPDEVRAKLDAVASDAFDVVFIGSSQVQYGIDPLAFDAALAERGCRVRSFNFGLPGMFRLESDMVLREVLALAPTRLRWIFLEFRERGIREAGGDEAGVTHRAVSWHSARNTRIALDSTWRGRRTIAEKLDRTADHLGYLFRRELLVGQGPALFQRRDGPPEAAVLLQEGSRGYEPREAHPDYAKRRRRFAQDPSGFIARRQRMLKEPDPKTFSAHVASYDRSLIEAQRHAIRSAGYEAVWFLAPSLQAPHLARRLRADGTLPVLYEFNDPSQFPQLYEVASRFDEWHLTQPAAREFSALLAQRFAADLAKEGGVCRFAPGVGEAGEGAR